jgi:hypothetical protein
MNDQEKVLMFELYKESVVQYSEVRKAYIHDKKNEKLRDAMMTQQGKKMMMQQLLCRYFGGLEGYQRWLRGQLG